jgi:hypothetical protein
LYAKRREQFEDAKRVAAEVDQAAHIERIKDAKRAADQAAYIERIEDAKRAAHIKRTAEQRETTRKWQRKLQEGKRQRTQQPKWKQRWYGAYEEQAISLAIKQYNDSSRTQILHEYLLNYEFNVQ